MPIDILPIKFRIWGWDIVMPTFAERLRFARERFGWTQAELADKLGAVPSTINKYEAGTREPDATTLSRIADTLQVTVDYLLGRDNPPPTPADTVVTFTDGRQVAFSELTPEERAAVESIWQLVSARLAKEQGKK
jgi:transcriptional regulator with XRE-family HTH domain